MSVAIQIPRMNIGCSPLISREHTLFPLFGGIIRLNPIGEPLSIWKTYATFSPSYNFRSAVAINVSDSHVVRSARGIVAGENVSCPFIRSTQIFRRFYPDNGKWEFGIVGTSAGIGDQVLSTVAIDIARNETVGTEDDIVHYAVLPWFSGEGIVWALKPEHGIIGTNEIHISIAINV